MKKYFNILRKCPLFNDIDDNNLSTMLACLGAKTLSFDKIKIIVIIKTP